MDSDLVIKVRELIRELKNGGIGVILISHNMEDTFTVTDRLIVMQNGRDVGERLVTKTDEKDIFALIMGLNIK